MVSRCQVIVEGEVVADRQLDKPVWVEVWWNASVLYGLPQPRWTPKDRSTASCVACKA